MCVPSVLVICRLYECQPVDRLAVWLPPVGPSRTCRTILYPSLPVLDLRFLGESPLAIRPVDSPFWSSLGVSANWDAGRP